MKVLFIAAYAPWPLHAGNSVRVFYLLDGLIAKGHDVTLLAGTDGAAVDIGPLAGRLADARTFRTRSGSGAAVALRGWLLGLPYPFARFLTRSLKAEVRRALAEKRFDAVIVNLVPLGNALPLSGPEGPAVLLDEGESQEALWQGYVEHGNLAQRVFARINLPVVRRAERKAIARARGVVSVSQEEANLRRAEGNGARTAYVPNGVDLAGFRPTARGPSTPPHILFLANLAIRRNASAAVWFADHVLPAILAADPTIEFRIVGRDPRPEVRLLGRRKGITVVPNVEDVRPAYAAATLAILPYWFGAGTKLKALEAMAMALPQVSTPAGVLGLEVKDGQHVLIARTPEKFAEACLRLLRNPALARNIGQNARRLVEERYAWPRVADALDEALQAWSRPAGARGVQA